MAEIVELTVETREKRGTAEARRLRRQGRVPGNIYGHGGDPVAISVPEDVFTPLVFAGQKVVDAKLADRNQLAILRDLQWDTFGTKILHFDLLRIDPDEKVEVEIPVNLRGLSPGSLAGGVLTQNLHTLSVECLAYVIPDQFEVRIGDLNIGDAIHVSDLQVPDGVVVMNEPDELVVQVTEPMEVPEEDEEVDAGAVEPEVIGRHEDEDESD